MGATGSACQEAPGPASWPDFVARPMKTPATAAAKATTTTTATTTAQARRRPPAPWVTGDAGSDEDSALDNTALPGLRQA